MGNSTSHANETNYTEEVKFEVSESNEINSGDCDNTMLTIKNDSLSPPPGSDDFVVPSNPIFKSCDSQVIEPDDFDEIAKILEEVAHRVENQNEQN